MKVKTADLIRTPLDWAVAKVFGIDWYINQRYFGNVYRYGVFDADAGAFEPSTNPAQGHPILERERIWLCAPHNEPGWFAELSARYYGPTMLIAGLRCYVASKLGDEVDIPEELCNAL